MTDTRTPLFALGGPAVLGAIIGLRGGALPLARTAATVPGVLVAVTLLMVPALYIGTALVGAAPSPGAMGRAVARGLRVCGILLLGLAAPVAFLLATAGEPVAGAVVGGAVLAAGALVALRVVWVEVFGPGASLRGMALFGGWALVALALGGRLYAGALGMWR